MRFLVLFSFLLFGLNLQAQVQVSRTFAQMGSVFQIVVVESDSVVANQKIDAAIIELERIENLLSEWRPTTSVSQVNAQAGKGPVKVPAELCAITQRGLHFSKLTHGAFDLTVAALDKVWYFDGSMDELPTKQQVRESVAHVNYRWLRVDESASTIELKRPGMKFGFGSIGKGYAADRGRMILQGLGVKAGIVNASGDLATWGTQLDGSPWRIGITNPYDAAESLRILSFENAGVATSGSYEKYAEIDGVRYAHIINPKTGWPSSGITSVTVWGASCETANGLSTSVMALGLRKGLKLLKRFPDYHYVILLDSGELVESKR